MEKIDWQEWTAETLARARAEDKPILLDLDATWCHWCHVMEETSYSDQEVVRLVIEGFIAIRVDPDRRPEINDRYNQGGWPTTALLAPSGEVLFGATYVSPEQMRELLARTIELWRTKREDIRTAIDAFRQRAAEGKAAAARRGPAPEDALQEVIRVAKEQYDFSFGGFASPAAGYAPKFPFPEMLHVCLAYYSLTEDGEALEMARKSLDGMLGLWDREEGGFYRYAVQRNWREPHYEKMLQSNALLLSLYLHGWQVTGETRYREAAEGVIRWLLNTVGRPGGGFWGSQDADGEEAYYGRSLAERAKMPKPSVDHTVFTDWNADAARALLEAFLLLGEEDYLRRATETVDYLLAECRQDGGPMFHYQREGERALPGLLQDQARMIRALSRAYQITAEQRYLQAAEELARYLLDHLLDKEGGGFFDLPAPAGAEGLSLSRRKEITENALAAAGLLELSQLTDNAEYQAAAEGTLEFFAEEYSSYGPFAAAYALAARQYHKPAERAEDRRRVGAERGETGNQGGE